MQSEGPAVVPEPEPASLDLPPPPPKNKRRSKAFGPPFDEILYAQNGRMMSVKLEVPAADEECPLTLSPIADDALECLQPTTVYLTAFPDVKKMVLPCGHAFGALSVLYHFLRRNMLCPCCRAGIDSKLSSTCIPGPFRKTLTSKVQAELRKESDEQMSSDRRAARSLAQQARGSNLVYILDLQFICPDVILPRNYHLNVCFMSYNETRPPLAQFNMPLIPHLDVLNPERFIFSVPGGTGRTLFDLQLTDPSVTAVSLSIISDSSEQVASTGTIVFDRTQNREVHCVSAEGESQFYMELHGGATRVHTLTWTAPAYLVGMH